MAVTVYKGLREATRAIPADNLKRAEQVPDTLLGPYLDEVASSIHQYLDQWRFGKSDAHDLNIAVDAFLALLAETERRGFM